MALVPVLTCIQYILHVLSYDGQITHKEFKLFADSILTEPYSLSFPLKMCHVLVGVNGIITLKNNTAISGSIKCGARGAISFATADW